MLRQCSQCRGRACVLYSFGNSPLAIYCMIKRECCGTNVPRFSATLRHVRFQRLFKTSRDSCPCWCEWAVWVICTCLLLTTRWRYHTSVTQAVYEDMGKLCKLQLSHAKFPWVLKRSNSHLHYVIPEQYLTLQFFEFVSKLSPLCNHRLLTVGFLFCLPRRPIAA